MLKAGSPDRSNYFNYNIDGDKNASCCATTGRKLLALPDIPDRYIFFLNTWNTLPQSYQQSVYNHTLATVQCQIQQVENQMPAVVIRMNSVHADNAILLDYLTFKVGLEENEIGDTDPNILIDNNYGDEQYHFGIPAGSGDYEDDADDRHERDDIPTLSQQWWAMTRLQRLDVGTGDVNAYEGDNGNDADTDDEEEASQAIDGSMQNMEDSGHSTRECEDWTVYFRPAYYDNGEPNATASDVSEAKTVL